MPARYQDVIALAEELATSGGSEAALRTAVNRYYYGTLWLVREALIPQPRRRNAHDQARDELGRRTRRAIGLRYQELHELRAAADYNPAEGQWQRKVVTAKRLHGRIVAELRRRGLITTAASN